MFVVSLRSISLHLAPSAALLLGSVSLGSLGSVSATPHPAFERWAGLHGKTYVNETEHAHRRAIWSDNVERIQRHNAGGSAYHMTADGPFSDLTSAEWSQRMGRLDTSSISHNTTATLLGATNFCSESLDWRDHDAVTAVKNQKDCGGCWSFAATGAVEGAWAIAGHDLVALSEQQLLDCDTSGDDQACDGGLPRNAYEYIKSNGGIDSEADYRYRAKQHACNREKEDDHVAHISDWAPVSQDEDQLRQAVCQGPVSVGIAADADGFKQYGGGVLTAEACGDKVDHAVLIVGFGSDTDTGLDYWLVKNSWSDTWGEDGYVRIARGTDDEDGVCSINTLASYPIV